MKFCNKVKSFNNYVFWKIATILFETYARIVNKRFFCRALKGDSFYNICINSDMSVSCNCNDRFGQGRIGDLSKQSLKKIFAGEKAGKFRKLLAQGKLPTIHCLFCMDLCKVNKEAAEKYITDFKTPNGIMIENTVDCNLQCICCMREQICSLRRKRSMTLEDLKNLSLQLKQNNVKIINFFNLGEPFFSNRIKKELEIIREHNPDAFIVTSTNGYSLDSEEKRQAALLIDEIVFSVPGSTQDSVIRYQKGTDFNRVYANMKTLVKDRAILKRKKPIISWKYILFRWNDSRELILHAINLAKEAEIDRIYFFKTLWPTWGISYKHYLNMGYLNSIGQFNNEIFTIELKK